jgi:hypothetical protein
MANRKLLWAALSLCASVAFVALIYPIYVIRPFRAQGEDELAMALTLKHWAPAAAFVAAVGSALAAGLLWRTSPRAMSRAMALALAGFAAIFAALTHINVYELMFHRIDAPQAIAAADAKLEKDDMVLAIRANGHSRAYPIRAMGYHHIANDWVGGVPVVATY